MTDEYDRWLDEDAAELLLRGESLDAVLDASADSPDAAARKRAARLADALGAARHGLPLNGESRAVESAAGAGAGSGTGEVGAAGAAGGELPGEAAALAAFRQARATREAAPLASSTAAAPSEASVSFDSGDSGPASASASVRDADSAVAVSPPASGIPVRTRLRIRWGRSVRLGIAAALAACTLGGVAVAAGTGVLPTPFGSDGDDGDPRPGGSVSAAATPPGTRTGPSPGATSPVERDDRDGDPDDGDRDSGREDGGQASDTDESGGRTDTGSDTDSDSDPDPDPDRTDSDAGRPEGGTKSPAPGGGSAGRDEQSPDDGQAEARPGLTPAQQRDLYRRVVTACRDYQSGKSLAAEARRRLERAANGAGNVAKLCDRALAAQRDGGDDDGGGSASGGDHGSDAGSDDQGRADDSGNGNGSGDRGGPADSGNPAADHGRDAGDGARQSLDDTGSSVTHRLGSGSDTLRTDLSRDSFSF
ncbi:hypothetical protein ACX6XY_13420 [Streptomyces sp. O3]